VAVSRQLTNSFEVLSDTEQDLDMEEEVEAAVMDHDTLDGSSSPRKRKADAASSTHKQSIGIQKLAPPSGSQTISKFFKHKNVAAPSEVGGLPGIPEHSTLSQS
jgi:hypothetical protein